MIRFLRRAEKILAVAGLTLLCVYAAAWVHKAVLSRASLRAFESMAAAASLPAKAGETPVRLRAALAGTESEEAVDFSLWSEQRIREYRASLAARRWAPLAVLSIPKLGLVVPVLEGTDDLTLNRGVGHIEDTARPGHPGNVGIAGHRDGFFRGLKDVDVGDELRLATTGGTESFRIERITIVQPDDVSVLDETSHRVVTLVTCYPFYFVGSAPLRYIVRAVRVEGAP